MAGLDVSRDQVARLMAAEGIRGASPARKHFTTRSDPGLHGELDDATPVEVEAAYQRDHLRERAA